MGIVSMEPNEPREPDPDALIDAVGAVVRAPLPQFNPSVLVLDVQRLLAEAGITVIVDLGNANTAVSAAADLLRALGVAPASAPWRQR